MTSLVVISGVNQGLGLILAKEAVKRGLVVEGVGRSARTQEVPIEVAFTQMDCTDDEKVPAFWRRLREQYGPETDVKLINNAGKFYRGELVSMDFRTARKIMADNYLAAVNMTLGFLDHFQSGTIVNLNSYAGLNPGPELTVYSAAKGALRNFFASLRGELSQRGIRIMNLYPYRINTWSEEREPGTIDKEEIARWIIEMVQLQGSFEIADCTLLPFGRR